MPRTPTGAKKKSRERVLSNAELKAIWIACPDDEFGAVVKLLALTGQRRTEIGALRWDEVHDDQIVLPANRTKNKRAHVVPLSDAARTALHRFRDGHDEFVFGRFGFQAWDQGKRALDARIADAGKSLEPWTLHDLRRTVATRISELGVQPHIIEAVLNHISGHKAGVAGIYNRSSYEREVRNALAMWADHINSITQQTERKIIPISRVSGNGEPAA